MQWIDRFDLFLFDFDGLLVDTESLHYQAYVNMCAKNGEILDWDFSTFLSIAHKNGNALKEAIYGTFPDLQQKDWKDLYEEKKQYYMELLQHGKVELMPGVYSLLEELEKKNKKRCVVTNSTLPQTNGMKVQHKILRTIPHWITREDYIEPKPHPECYLRAIDLYGEKGDRIIGFEDSLRGIKALLKTPAKPVLVCPPHYPLLETSLDAMVQYFPALDEIPETNW